MASSFARGWELVKESSFLLWQDKKLMLFPILSSTACLLVAASFVVPCFVIPELGGIAFFEQLMRDPDPASADRLLSYAIGFLFYFVNYFVIVFFNVALVSCALARFRGGDPTVGDGLRAAWQRLPQILAWALVAATVGKLLEALEKKLGILGKIAIALVGTVWSMAIYFVVPVLAAERVGPLEAVKRSSKVLVKTWGEALVANISMSAIGFLFVLPALGLLFVGSALLLGAHGAQSSVVPGIILISCAVIYFLGLAIVFSTLQQIFLAGAYLFATEGVVAPGFKEEVLREAFRKKQPNEKVRS